MYWTPIGSIFGIRSRCAHPNLDRTKKHAYSAYKNLSGTEAVLDKITEKANSITDLGCYTAITQVLMILPEIELAKALGISNAMICKAINAGGGNIKTSYFSEALHYARKKAQKLDMPPLPRSATPKRAVEPPASAAGHKFAPGSKKAREEKAKEYTSSISNNPIFKKHIQDKEE